MRKYKIYYNDMFFEGTAKTFGLKILEELCKHKKSSLIIFSKAFGTFYLGGLPFKFYTKNTDRLEVYEIIDSNYEEKNNLSELKKEINTEIDRLMKLKVFF